MDGRIACCRPEPSLDELLSDEMMRPVLKSAGFDPQRLKELMAETARRIDSRGRQAEGQAAGQEEKFASSG